MAGLSSTGFEIATLAEILAEIEQEQLDDINPNLNLSSTSVLGQLNAIYASKAREIWELAQAIYNASYPSSASGSALSELAALTGTERRAATYSTVVATLNLDAATTVPSGSAANVSGDAAMRYELTEDLTSIGAGDYEAMMTATTAGSTIIANAGTLTVIATPVSGWNSVTNAADSVDGLNEETDAELRLRREEELRAAGDSTVEAIRSDLLQVDNVTHATVFENTTDVTNADGVPPHGIECLVLGGTDTDVSEQIWESKPAGIATYGSSSESVTDSQGIDHTIYFTRPSTVDIYVECDLTVDSTYAGDAAVKSAIEGYEDILDPGDDVIYAKIYDLIFNVTGVVDVTDLQIDDDGAPASGTSNIVISTRELANFDTANIVVNS